MEPTKVCSRCHERKPWSAFHNYYRKGNARPLSRCKACDREHRAELTTRNPEREREYRATYYQRLRQDPERYFARLEAERTRKRRRRGTDPSKHRTSRIMREANVGNAHSHDAGPFRDWLGTLTAREIRTLPASTEVLRRILNGRQDRVSIDTVDRCCLHVGTASLDTLYPPSVCAA